MDNNGNRLFLNFGNNNERLAPTDRTYPTTPSTFPQPVFQSSSSNQPPSSAAGAQQGQAYSSGYSTNNNNNNNYFSQNQYASTQYGSSQYQGGADCGASQGYQQARSTTPGTSNDPNTGLAHQFSHQNLGGAARAGPQGSRGPSPAQRPRTAGATGQQPGYGSYLSAPLPTQPTQFEFAAAPNEIQTAMDPMRTITRRSAPSWLLTSSRTA